jgi:hypothetical protein
LRLLRNIGIARMMFRIWKRIGDEAQHQKLPGPFGNALMRSDGATMKMQQKQIDSAKCGVLVLNLRVKHALKRLLLIWHYEASIEKKCKRVNEIEHDADQTRAQLSGEMRMLEAQRKSYEGEVEKIRTRSHQLAQRTVETLFGSNVRLILQSCFNKLKNCAMESRTRRIEELQESLLHVGQNTAFKLLQYETAITMANDYCVRRLLPEIAFLTWKKATVINQSIHESNYLKTRVAELESLHESLPVHESHRSQISHVPSQLTQERIQTSMANSTVMEAKGHQNEQTNRKIQHYDESQNARVFFDRPPERLDQSASTQKFNDQSVTTANRSAKDSASENTTSEIASQNLGRHPTFTQLASFLMPGVLDQSISSSPLLGILHEPASKHSFEEMTSHNSSLIDLQQKLSRLESRWASIRLNTS